MNLMDVFKRDAPELAQAARQEYLEAEAKLLKKKFQRLDRNVAKLAKGDKDVLKNAIKERNLAKAKYLKVKSQLQ